MLSAEGASDVWHRIEMAPDVYGGPAVSPAISTLIAMNITHYIDRITSTCTPAHEAYWLAIDNLCISRTILHGWSKM